MAWICAQARGRKSGIGVGKLDSTRLDSIRQSVQVPIRSAKQGVCRSDGRLLGWGRRLVLQTMQFDELGKSFLVGGAARRVLNAAQGFPLAIASGSLQWKAGQILQEFGGLWGEQNLPRCGVLQGEQD